VTTAILDNAKTEEIPLDKIVSNVGQARGMGVLTQLKELGWGIFEKASLDPEKSLPLWEMLLHQDPEIKQQAVKLIDEFEPELVKTADSMRLQGQMQEIGVRRVSAGYDTIWGMRRCLGAAYNHAKYRTKPVIRAKTTTAKLSDIDLLILSEKENDDREDSSPIDKAITFAKLKKVGKMTTAKIAHAIGRSDQYVNWYMKLLDPLIEDKKMDIHLGRFTPNQAHKLLEQRKQDRDAQPAASTRNKTRCKMRTTKETDKILDQSVKPKSVSDKEWEFYKNAEVRKYLFYMIGRKFKDYKPPVEKSEETTHAESNGTAEAPPVKAVVLKVKKDRAVRLLISIGQTNARQYDDATLRNKLENMPNQLEAGQKSEDTSLQGLLDKLLQGYAQGLVVEIQE
jgi:ParB/RepB/Spo0J family partition protein